MLLVFKVYFKHIFKLQKIRAKIFKRTFQHVMGSRSRFTKTEFICVVYKKEKKIGVKKKPYFCVFFYRPQKKIGFT